MIVIEPHAGGATFGVRAQPKARRNAIVGEHQQALRVAVRQAPEDGKANAAIVELLAEALQVAKSRVQILRGAAGRNKQVLVVGLSPDELARRIAALV